MRRYMLRVAKNDYTPYPIPPTSVPNGTADRTTSQGCQKAIHTYRLACFVVSEHTEYNENKERRSSTPHNDQPKVKYDGGVLSSLRLRATSLCTVTIDAPVTLWCPKHWPGNCPIAGSGVR